MSFKAKSKEKIVSAFCKIFRWDKLKTNESKSDENNNQCGSIDNKSEKTADHSANKKSGNERCSFQTEGAARMKSKNKASSSSESKINFKTIQVKRLMKELADIKRLNQASDAPAFTVELVDDKLDEWHVKVSASSFDSSSELYVDLKKLNISHILLQINFPPSFPFVPPFIHVVSPSIDKGFVMDGGALCLELLTPRGWSSAYSVESIIMQFTASVVKGHGRVSKAFGRKSFSRKSAEEAFRNLVRTHDKYGWVTPSLADG